MKEIDRIDKINEVRAKMAFMSGALANAMEKQVSEQAALGGYLLICDLEEDLKALVEPE